MQLYLRSSEFIDSDHPAVIAQAAELPEIWPEPLDMVVKALRQNATYDQVYRNLPDIPLWRASTI
jgi:hypothetical protein